MYKRKYFSEKDLQLFYNVLKYQLKEKWVSDYKGSKGFSQKDRVTPQLDFFKRHQSYFENMGLGELVGFNFLGVIFSKLSDKLERFPTYKELFEESNNLGLFSGLTVGEIIKNIVNSYDLTTEDYNYLEIAKRA